MEVIVVVLGCVLGWIFWATDPWGIFAATKRREAEERKKRAWERCERELKAMAEREQKKM